GDDVVALGRHRLPLIRHTQPAKELLQIRGHAMLVDDVGRQLATHRIDARPADEITQEAGGFGHWGTVGGLSARALVEAASYSFFNDSTSRTTALVPRTRRSRPTARTCWSAVAVTLPISTIGASPFSMACIMTSPSLTLNLPAMSLPRTLALPAAGKSALFL